MKLVAQFITHHLGDNLGYAVLLRAQDQSLSAWTLSGRGTAGPAYRTKLEAGRWHHVALVCSRKTGRTLFLNRKPVAHQRGEADLLPCPGPLTIGANCWLGARVTVLDAADVGEHCVIGAGAVVNRPLPADTLAAGVPARKIKSI